MSNTLALPLDLTAQPPRVLCDVHWSTVGNHVALEVHDGTETARYIATPEQVLALWGELAHTCAELVQAGLLPPTNTED